MIRRLTAFGLLTFLILLLVNGLVPQMQMLLFSGNVKILSSLLTSAFLLLFLGIAFSLRPQIKMPNTVFAWWVIFVGYVTIDYLFIFLKESYKWTELMYNVYNYFFILLLLPFLSTVRNALREETTIKTLLLLFIPTAMLGIFQHFNKASIIPIESLDGTYKIVSLYYVTGEVRAYSFFDSAFSFGHFISLVAGITTVLFLTKKRFVYLTLLGLVFLSGYSTLTRNTYIEIAATVFFSLIFTKSQPKRQIVSGLIYLPIPLGIFACILTFVVPVYVTDLLGSNSILNGNSIDFRYAFWSLVIKKWLNGDITDLLFGNGAIQGNEIIIDNSFLAVGMQLGIIGLLLWVILMWKTWKVVYWLAMQERTPLSVGIAGLWSTWIMTGVNNINIVIYSIAFGILLMHYTISKDKITEAKDSEQKRSKRPNSVKFIIK